MDGYAYYEYISFDQDLFFTVVLLPEKEGRFPTVICRSPYVNSTLNKSEDSVVNDCFNSFKSWLDRGYAIVYQHCRGQGKSTGAFVPYVHEREDGLALRKWIRNQSFYNGELFLVGSSYSSSLHYTTFPFEDDIKGAVFEVQDTERYRLWYRNGQMRKGHANWHFGLYKSKCGLNKAFSMNSFAELPLKGLSERVLGDRADDFEEMLAAQFPSDKFWDTRFGGNDAKNATDNADIPMLLTTGYNDYYIGGIFKMWSRMDQKTKEKSALLVSPYNHGDGYNKDHGLPFKNGKRSEQFGNTYQIDWFDNIRKGLPLPYKKGVITYYRTFEDRWESDFYSQSTEDIKIPLGDGIGSFKYDPLSPPSFSCEGSFAEEINPISDVISIYTDSFSNDTFVRGQMRALLTVSSDRPDTSFYIRISIKSDEHTYVLRHDITSLHYALGDYTPNTEVTLEFSFDEYAFLLKKGDRLQIDIAGTDDNTYVSHTNRKGDYYLQTGADTATNKVYLDRSYLILPVE